MIKEDLINMKDETSNELNNLLEWGSKIDFCVNNYYNFILSKIYYEILESECPNKEDFNNEEEYIEACKKFQLDLLNNLREDKNAIYLESIDEYSDYLSKKDNGKKLDDAVGQIFTILKDCELSGLDKKYNYLIAADIGAGVIVSSVVPNVGEFPLGPFIAGFFIARLIINLRKKLIVKAMIDAPIEVNAYDSSFKKEGERLYQAQSNLRFNHFSDEKKYKELIIKINSSENVIQELLDIANPENFGFKLLSQEEMDLMHELLGIDSTFNSDFINSVDEKINTLNNR